jgi:hypothetical protein
MEESDDEPEDPAESNPFVSKGVCSCERQRSTIPAITLSHQAANVADAALSCIVNIRLPYVSLLWRAAEEDDQEGGASKCPIGLPGVPKMGVVLHELVSKFPLLDGSAVIQPITS